MTSQLLELLRSRTLAEQDAQRTVQLTAALSTAVAERQACLTALQDAAASTDIKAVDTQVLCRPHMLLAAVFARLR